MPGLEVIPLRIPQQWDPVWFERFVLDVLAKADVRNAIPGPGISIDGTSDTPATISGSADVDALLDENFILAEPSSLLANARVLDGEASVVEVNDSGPGGIVRIAIAPHGISYSKMRKVPAFSLIGNPTGATAEVTGVAIGDGLAVSGSTLNGTPTRMPGATWVRSGGAIATPVNDVSVYVPVDATILAVVVLTDGGPGNCTIDIQKTSLSDYPGGFASICGGNEPEISSGHKLFDDVLTDWDPGLAAGDCLRFLLKSSATFTYVHVALVILENT